jgi:hypothetical protein
MEGIAVLAAVACVVLIFVGWFMVMMAGFREHVLWGLAILVFGPAYVAFSILHWPEARRGFLYSVYGFLAFGLTILVYG